MNLIPNTTEEWNLDTINELIKLRDIESEKFDFKGKDMKGLPIHLCAMQKCDEDAQFAVIEYFFPDIFSKKPFCKAMWRVCWKHAKMLSHDYVVSRIQVLS